VFVLDQHCIGGDNDLKVNDESAALFSRNNSTTSITTMQWQLSRLNSSLNKNLAKLIETQKNSCIANTDTDTIIVANASITAIIIIQRPLQQQQ
jgi:hypothetical protein